MPHPIRVTRTNEQQKIIVVHCRRLYYVKYSLNSIRTYLYCPASFCLFGFSFFPIEENMFSNVFVTAADNVKIKFLMYEVLYRSRVSFTELYLQLPRSDNASVKPKSSESSNKCVRAVNYQNKLKRICSAAMTARR